MESFYITLPSTASSHLYHNTQSHFRVQLPKPLELEGDWVVGLSEIHVPTVWNNIDENTNIFTLHARKGLESINLLIPAIEASNLPRRDELQYYKNYFSLVIPQLPKHLIPLIQYTVSSNDQGVLITVHNASESDFHFPQFLNVNQVINSSNDKKYILHYDRNENIPTHAIKVTYPSEAQMMQLKIPSGYYAKVSHVLQAITEAMSEDVRNRIHFKHNRDGTLSITCDKHIALEFPRGNHGLGSLLGFADEQTLLSGISTGKYTVDLNRGVHGLYVYTDIINPHIVGDTMSPLLRVIPVENDSKYSYVKIYSNPDFYKLLHNRFETIEISVRTDAGTILSFRHGKTLVKLLFKKV